MYGHVLPNFLGWVDLLSNGAPLIDQLYPRRLLDLMPERGLGVCTGFLRRRVQALSTYIIQCKLDITKA